MDDFSFDTYASYGLSENPFLVHALNPNSRGRRLLVGRDDEVKLVAQCLHKDGKITCLDGHVGVGKTSLVNVAAHLCYEGFLKGKTPQLLVPVAEPFQLKKEEDINAFCSNVFRRVAQTLLMYRKDLQDLDQLPIEAVKLDAWLNSPIVEHITGALGATLSVGVPSMASFGVSTAGSASKQINSSSAFAEQGFEQLIKGWLEQIFVIQGNGGVVCIIDNLELLESGVQARRVLEVLRDRLFSVKGLRWVFCGANGVIHSLAASERLGAYLNTPVIDVAHVQTSALEPLFHARFKEFAMSSEDDAWSRLPITLQDLQALYPILNFNLRDLLALADEYCEVIHRNQKTLIGDTHKTRMFAKWLETETIKRYHVLSSRLPSDAWVILDLVMSDDFRGIFGIGDYQSLNQNSLVTISRPTFEKRLRDLVKHGLVSKSIDDEIRNGDGFSREVFTVTAKGSMVHYARLVKQENQRISPLTWLRRVH